MATELGRDTDRALVSGNPSAVAAAIVRSGQRRRGELIEEPPAPRNETERLAQAIVHAGRLRRNEVQDTSASPPVGSTAWKILEAGRRRRGELP